MKYRPPAFDILSKSPNAQRIQTARRNWWARIGYRLRRKEWRSNTSRFVWAQRMKYFAQADKRGVSIHRFKPPMNWRMRRLIDSIKRQS